MENDELIRRAEDLCRRCEKTAASSHIAEGAASLNYSVCIKNDALISPGDIISLRGCGKAAVSASGGVSRKGRLFVEAEIYK